MSLTTKLPESLKKQGSCFAKSCLEVHQTGDDKLKQGVTK